MGKTKTLPLLARCVDATKSLPAAILLYRVCYWQQHASVEWAGHMWIAKAREDWAEETGLSLDQYKRAASELRRGNLIETEKHFFNQRQVTYTRLLSRGQVLLGGGKVADYDAGGLVQICTDQGCNIAPTHGAISHHSIYKGDTKGGTKGDYSGDPSGITGEIPVADDCSSDYDDPGKEAPMASIADKLKNPTKKPKSLKGKADTLPELWVKIRAEQTGEFQTPMTQKDRGQLKKFGQSCPQGKADDILETILKEWAMFAGHVKTSAGIHTTPSQPNVGFVLKHVNLAVQFHTWFHGKPKTTTTGNTVTLAPEEPHPSAGSQKPKEKEKKMSWEELQAIMSEDDEE